MLLLEALDLDQRFRLDLLRHAGGFDLLAELVRRGGFAAGLAQLLLNGAELLAQVVLALLLVHPGLRLGLDLLAQVQHVEPLLDEHAEPAQALHRVEQLQQLLPLIGAELRREGDQVGQPARLLDAAHHRQHFFRHVRKHADVALHLLHDGGHRRFRFRGRIDRVVVADDPRHQVRVLLHQLGDDAAGQPLQDDMAVAAGAELGDLGDDADPAELVLLRRRLRVGDPDGLAVVAAPRRFDDGVGQQRPQLAVIIRGATCRSAVRFRVDGPFRENQHVPVLAARGAIDDPRRFLILDGEGNRHVGQKERLIHHQHGQEHVGGLARGALLGSGAPRGTRLGSRRGDVRGRSGVDHDVLLRRGLRRIGRTSWHG